MESAAPNFPRTMIEVARQGKPLRVVNDQIGCPTFTNDLAQAMVDLTLARAAGIFHCTNCGPTSWYDFAKATLDTFGVPARPSARHHRTIPHHASQPSPPPRL